MKPKHVKKGPIDYISIPRGLPSVLVNQNTQLKAVAILYQLKSIYVGGVILDHRKQLQMIADSFGYSKRKLTDYIKILKEEGLAEEDLRNGNLLLRSSKFINTHFGLKEAGFHKVLKSELANIEYVLKSLALEQNLRQQEHVLAEKIIHQEIANNTVGIIQAKSLSKAANRRLRKAIKPELPRLLKQEQTRYTTAITDFQPSHAPIMPFVTLSRQGVAKTVNRKSKSTGHRLMKKLVKLGYMNDAQHNLTIGSYTYDEYQLLQKNVVNYDFSYTYKNGEIKKVLPNNISSTAVFIFNK